MKTLLTVIFVLVVLTADANWPSHMGPDSVLLDTVKELLSH